VSMMFAIFCRYLDPHELVNAFDFSSLIT
jgi:hypothetical protein